MVNYLLRTSLRLLDTIYVSTCMKIFFSHYISEKNIFHIIINNYYSATTFLTQYSFQSVPIHIKKIQKFRGGGGGVFQAPPGIIEILGRWGVLLIVSRCFDAVFLSPHQKIAITLKVIYPCLIAMECSPLTDFALKFVNWKCNFK